MGFAGGERAPRAARKCALARFSEVEGGGGGEGGEGVLPQMNADERRSAAAPPGQQRPPDWRFDLGISGSRQVRADRGEREGLTSHGGMSADRDAGGTPLACLRGLPRATSSRPALRPPPTLRDVVAIGDTIPPPGRAQGGGKDGLRCRPRHAGGGRTGGCRAASSDRPGDRAPTTVSGLSSRARLRCAYAGCRPLRGRRTHATGVGGGRGAGLGSNVCRRNANRR